MPERTFTPEEANAALAEVRPLVERMVAARAALLEAQRRQAELVAVVEELERVGVQVKDLDRGLVDFPCLHRDRVVLLCWELGEDEVAYWHGADEGYAGRKPLPLE